MTGTPFTPGGALLLATVVLLAGSALGLLLLRGRRLRGIPAITAFFAAVVAGAVLAGTTAAAGGGPRPAAAARPGPPVVRELHRNGRHVPVMVVPNRPGLNLVGIGVDGTQKASAGTDRDRLTAGTVRAGSAQRWTTVNLPRGESRLWISAAGAVGSFTVDTGTRTAAPTALRGADAPECAAAAAGELAAGLDRPLTSCPSDRLTEADRSALRAVVTFLAGRGTRTAALVGDDSPRGRAAAAEVRTAAAAARITLAAPSTGPVTASARPLIVVAGWQRAQSVLQDVAAGRIRSQGSYLAPWLLTRSLLTPAAGQIIPLRFTPRTGMPMTYASALAARLPGEYPSATGYEAWRRASGAAIRADADPVRLYATAVMYIPGSPLSGPGAGGHHHGGATDVDWLPDGMIAPVAGPFEEKGA
ncbi:hypothetical protein [Streptomyces adustus]